MTNRNSFNGMEIVTGETIIIPMARRMFDTMRSMMMNGRYSRKPSWNAAVSSETRNAGVSTSKLSSDRSRDASSPHR